MVEPLEQLADAPIEEVASGIVFRTLTGLDPLLLGCYWRRRRSDYPGRELRPVVMVGEFAAQMIPLRALLVSADEQYVIQVQADRFYCNWRRRQAGYPRFATRDEREGLLAKTLREYRDFVEFCAEELKIEPAALGIELAKVDLLREGKHWSGINDLAEMLPWVRDFARFSTSGAPGIALTFDERRAGGTLNVSVVLGLETRPGLPDTRSLRLESRMVLQGPAASEAELEQLFSTANAELNVVFATLIPQEQREKRFNKRTS